MCGPNIKLVDLIYEAMREEPGFDLISADRQGEMAMEVEAILLAAMEDGDLQIVDEEDIRQAEGWAGKKAREYVRNELEGWK